MEVRKGYKKKKDDMITHVGLLKTINGCQC